MLAAECEGITMEYGFGFFKADAANGCQNNTIRNCVITLNRLNNASGAGPAVDGSRGINMVNALIGSQTTVLTVTASTGANSGNGFYTNTIQNCNIGIALIGYAAASPFTLADFNNDIGGNSILTGNSILNFGGGGLTSPAAAVRTLAQYNLNVSYNTVINNNGAGINHGTTLRGIYINTAASANVSVTHNSISITGGGSTSQVSAIENLAGAGAASNSVVIDNNTFSNCSNSSNTSGTYYYIFNNGSSSAYLSVSSNTFLNNINLASSGSTYDIYNTGAVTGVIRFSNNAILSSTVSASSTGNAYMLYNNAISTASFEACNNTFSNTVQNLVTGSVYFAYNAQATNGTITFTNNLLSANSFSAGGGVFYGLYNAGSSSGNLLMANNNFSGNSILNSSGSAFGIYNTANITGNSDLKFNVFSTYTLNFSTTGSFYGIYNNAASAFSLGINNNQFSGFLAGAASGSIHMVYNRGPVSTTFTACDLSNNSISASSFTSSSTSPFLGVYNSLLSCTDLSMNSNSLTALTWNSPLASKYLVYNNGTVSGNLSMNNNLISGNDNSSGSAGNYFGLYNTGSVGNQFLVTANRFDNCQTFASTGSVYLVNNSGVITNTVSMTGNSISNWSGTVSGSGSLYGLYFSGSSGSRIDLSANTFTQNTFSLGTGALYLISSTGPVATSIGTISISSNTLAAQSFTSNSSASWYALYNNGVSAQVLTMNANTFSLCSGTSSTGACHLVYNRGALTNTFNSIDQSNNVVVDFTFNGNSTGAFYGVYNNGVTTVNQSMNANSFSTIQLNSSVGARYMLFNSGVASASVSMENNLLSGVNGTANTSALFCFLNNSSSSGLSTKLALNAVSNSQLNSSTGDIIFIQNTGNSAGPIQFSANSFSAVSANSSASGRLIGIYNNAASATTLSVLNNTVTACSRTAATGANVLIYCLGTGATTCSALEIISNRLDNINYNATSNGAYYQVFCNGGNAGNLSILNNTINAMNWNSVSADRYLIANTCFVSGTSLIQQNQLSSFSSTANTTASFYGIYNAAAASSAGLFVLNNRISDLQLNASSGAIQLISSSGALNGGVTMSSNSLQNFTFSSSGSGNQMGIYNASPSSAFLSMISNSISNGSMNFNSGSAYPLYNTAACTNSILMQQNLVSAVSSSATGTGQLYIIYNNAAGSNFLSQSSNAITQIQHLAQNGAMHFIYNRGTLANVFGTVQIDNNSVNGNTLYTSGLANSNYMIFNNGVLSPSLSISGNTLSAMVWQSTISDRYLIYNTGTCSLGISLQNNRIQNHISPLNTTGHFYGIYNAGPASSNLQIVSNVLDNLNSVSTTGRKYLIYNTGNLNSIVSINSNTLQNCSIVSGGNTSFFGILNTVFSSLSHSISANSISNNSVSTSTGSMALVYNLNSGSSGDLHIKNNQISSNSFSATGVAQFYAINNAAPSTSDINIDGNLIQNHSSQASQSNRYLLINTGTAPGIISVGSNTLSGVTYTGNTSGVFYGISNTAAGAGTLSIASNRLDQFNLISTNALQYGIHNSGNVSGLRSITTNSASNISASSSGSGTYYGIYNLSANGNSLAISGNTLSNHNLVSHSVAINLILNTGLATTTVSSISLDNNVISGGLQKIDTLAPFYGVFNNAVSAQVINLSGNRFLNHSLNVQQGFRYLVHNNAASSNSTTLNGNIFDTDVYTDSLSTAFYGVYNSGRYENALNMDNNRFNACSLSSKMSTLNLVHSSVGATSPSNLVSMSGNTISACTFSLTQPEALNMIYHAGDTVTVLNMNNNQISANAIQLINSPTYLIRNSSAVGTNLTINANLISSNSNSTSSTADFYGLYNSAAIGNSLSISSNTFSANTSRQVQGNTYLIFNLGLAGSEAKFNFNALSYSYNHSSQAFTGTFYGILNLAATASTQVIYNNNLFSALNFSTIAGLGPVYFIRNFNDPLSLNVSANIWNALQIRNAGAHYLIRNEGNVQSQISVNSNSVMSYARQFAGSSDFYFYYADAQNVPAGCVQTFSGNLISNVSSTVGGVGGFYGIYSVDGGLSPFPKKEISANSIQNINYLSSGDFQAYYANFMGDANINQPSSIHNNSLSAVNWSGNIFGVYHGLNNSPNQKIRIYANQIDNLVTNGSSSTNYAICLNGGSPGLDCYKNKIQGISATGSGARAHGIYVLNAFNTSIFNNRIGLLQAQNSNLLDPVNGIYIAAGNSLTLSYNSVYLNTSGTTPNFNSNALYAAGTVPLSLRNNILINLSAANGSGISAAFRRSNTSLSSLALNSNRNILYAGNSSSSQAIYTDPTNTIQSLLLYKNLLNPREQNSGKENVPFLSTLGNSPNFLMIDPQLPSLAESGAQNISGISDDFDSQVRQGNVGYLGGGTAPDIGSDEFNQSLPPCTSANAGTISPISMTVCLGQNITLNSAGYTYTAAGGMLFQWQSSAVPGGPYTNVSGGTGANSTEYSSIASSSGTMYVVLSATCSNNAQTAISNQATVVINPVPQLSVSSGSSLCSGNNLSLNLSSSLPGTYLWSGPNAFTSSLQNPVISNAGTGASGVYTAVVTTSSGCSASVMHTVTVYPSVPAFSFNPAQPAICIGDSVSISASLPVQAPVLNFTPQVSQNNANAYPAPYSLYYGGQKMQFLVLATELNAAGFVNGSALNSISFPVVSLGGGWGTLVQDCKSFQISVGHTTLTSLLSFQSGLTVVRPAYDFTPVAASFNTHSFSSPFVWDGNSNLVIETVFSNNMVGTAATAVMQYNSPAGFQSTVIYRADNQTFSAIAAATASNINVGAARPDFKLNALSLGSYTWSPSLGLSSANQATVKASPPVATQYSVTLDNGHCASVQMLTISVAQHPTLSAVASSTLLCVGNIATLSASGAATYSWSNGQNSASVQVSPAGNSTFVVTGFNAPCPGVSSAINMSVIPAILVSAAASTPIVCSGQTATLYANGANSYTWSNGANTSTTVVSPTVNSTFTVTGSNGPGCFAQQVLSLLSYSIPSISCNPVSGTVCPGGSLSFSATGAVSYTWLPLNLVAPGLLAIPAVSTTYTLVGKGNNGCTATTTVTAVVDPCVDINSYTSNGKGIFLFPNPSSGLFYLTYPEMTSHTLRLCDLNGQCLLEKVTEGERAELDLQNLEKGMYILYIRSYGGNFVFKLLIE
ncbi:MAG TPA: T9SS type A sorting domain-containing protein [Bacteroidia bacterium]|nr:T9SS type A sorting domain-containing protein [Bacteroidia bacterium]